MKTIIASTALALMVSTATMAQSQTMLKTYQSDITTDMYASEFIGMRVYSAEKDFDTFNADTRIAEGAETEWDDIGEVNDVILGRDGSVKAVILGVGGFIGIGEKDVALPMDAIKMVQEQDDADDFFLVVNASKDALTAANTYERMDDDAMVATTTDATTTEKAETVVVETNEATDATETVVAETAEKTEMAAAETAEGATEQLEKTAEATGDAVATGAAAVATTTEKVGDTVVTTTENAAAEVKEEVAEARMDGTRTMLRTPAVERDGFVVLATTDMTADKLEGARVYGLNDEDIGEVDEIMMDANGKFERAVLDIGGFLGIGEHEVAVTASELQFVTNADGSDVRVYVDATKEELEAQPEYND